MLRRSRGQTVSIYNMAPGLKKPAHTRRKKKKKKEDRGEDHLERKKKKANLVSNIPESEATSVEKNKTKNTIVTEIRTTGGRDQEEELKGVVRRYIKQTKG